METFYDGLHELGYVEGQNLVIEVRTSEGRIERLPALAADLVQLPVDVLVAFGTEATVAAKHATTTLPIAFSAGDPVRTGLVDSLARPGGVATGIASLNPPLSGKRLELLKESVPGLSAIAYLWNPTVPQGPVNWQETQVAAQALGLHLLSVEFSVDTADDLEGAFEAAIRGGAGGLALTAGTVNVANQERIVALAAEHHLPAMYPSKTFVVVGGLMSYTAESASAVRRLAYYADRILKGAKPADLPVEQPREFDFVINLRTAQALGLTIPQHVLLQATQVIQ